MSGALSESHRRRTGEAEDGHTAAPVSPNRRPTFSERVAAATPPGRDRALDGLRALALLGVVFGHWLVGVLVLADDGGVRISSPLNRLSELSPATWFFQMLGLFFLVGGYSATLSLRRAEERGERYGTWLRSRFLRLSRPVVAATALSAAALGMLAAAGVATSTLRSWIVLLVQPLWFVLMYTVATLLTRYALAADRLLGAWAAAPLPVIVAVVDLLRWGPWQESMPSWIGLINLLPAWFFGYQLGVCWARGRFDRVHRWVLLVGGATVFLLLVTKLGYPTSMVGVPGAERTNSHPPSLLVVALAATQSGAAMLLHERINRWLRRPRLWAGAALINLVAMSILCWHQVPLVVVSMFGGLAGGLPGLNELPMAGEVMWVFARVAWLPVFAALFVLVLAAVRRFEGPWVGVPRFFRVAVGVLTACFALAAASLW